MSPFGRSEAVAGGYLSPEPMLQSPTFTTSMAARGMQVPTYAYAANNPLMYVDPTGLDVCNYSSSTVFVKPEEGVQPIALAPGKCWRGSQDGFSLPARSPRRVFKTRDHVDACVRDSGEPELSWPGSGVPPLGPQGTMPDLIGLDQYFRGGWKDENWVAKHPDWLPLLNAGP